MDNSLVRFNIDSMAGELSRNISWNAAQIAQIDNGIFQIAMFNGAFEWHSHGEDKLFIIYKGSLTFWVKNQGEEQEYKLSHGDGLIIPADMERRRVAEEGTLVLTFDTSGHAGSHGTGPGQHTHDF